ncbi:MAG: hypothetical protein CMH57_13330 [Myxococcales bacterium]|nr:hypothetical protein [Myxococcales bacterium]
MTQTPGDADAPHHQGDREAHQRRQIAAISARLNLTDQGLAELLIDLGLDGRTCEALPFLPLVYVAWADGDVSADERAQLLRAAEAQGLDPDGDARAFLDDLLARRPADYFLTLSVQALRRIYELLPANEATRAKEDLVALALENARASGGFLGLLGDPVCADEHRTITEIIAALGLNTPPR